MSKFTIVGVKPLPKTSWAEKFRYINGAWEHKHEGHPLWHPIMRLHKSRPYQNEIVMFDGCIVKTTYERDISVKRVIPQRWGVVRHIYPVSWGFVVDVMIGGELNSFDIRNLELCSNVWYCQARAERSMRPGNIKRKRTKR
jgi:hypothetical protein